LLIARSDQDQLPLRREQVVAGTLLQAVADRFAVRAGEHGRTISVSAAENALSHGAGAIELSAFGRGDFVELHVTDEGPGLPAAFLPRAFDRFGRADEARSRGGTGLGLSIVELIARAHGGEAGAANRPGGGADVWITLESAQSSESSLTAPSELARLR
jgi:signal transduction histidine kinase